MNLPSIVDDLKLIITHANPIQAHKVTKAQLRQWINNQRALWLTNEYNKGRGIRNNEKQVLYNVELVVVDSAELSTEIDSEIRVLKSKYPIPRNLQLMLRDTLVSVRPLDVTSVRINYVPRELAIYSGNGVLNGKYLFAFKHDDHLYIKYGSQADTANILTNVSIEGVFENPFEVDRFNETEDDILLGKEHYPVSMQFVEFIKSNVLQNDFGALMQMPKDDKPDDESNS